MSKLVLILFGVAAVLVVCIILSLSLFGGVQTKNAELLQARLYNAWTRTYIGKLEVDDIALNYNAGDINNFTGYDVWVRFVKREKDDHGNVISDGSCIPTNCKKTKLSMTKEQYDAIGCKDRPTVALIMFTVAPSMFGAENGNTVYWNSIAIAITCSNGLQPGPTKDQKIATFLMDPTFDMTKAVNLPSLKIDPTIKTDCLFQIWTGAKMQPHQCAEGWQLASKVTPLIPSWEPQMRWVDWQSPKPKTPVTSYCIFTTTQEPTFWPSDWGCKDGPDEKLRPTNAVNPPTN